MNEERKAGKVQEDKKSSSAPSISLPKGGGAIRGIGEKFAANPVTGTGSMSVPIATSPGRSGFGPQLSLSYDSGAGNGPFGFGWSLSLPSITRKTDKGLPQYHDAEASDVFILSGAEDLVPVLKQQGNDWVPEDVPDRTVGPDTYRIQRYRPRIEGLFARIERWTNIKDPVDVCWRSISRDNITTWYGKTAKSRIADPDDKARIFSWLICQSYDDKGNAIVYEYAEENSQRIFEDHDGQIIALAHECNRDDKKRSANRYLKRIKYGNLKPNRDLTTWQAIDPTKLDKWMFEVVFDYGEGHYREQKARDASHHDYALAQIEPPAGSTWPVRQDPFSSYRAGFEVRTYRLCRRVLMFHHFPKELGIEDYLVRSTEFAYEQSPIASFIKGVTQSGYRYIEDQAKYLKKSLPPLEFEYSQATIQEDVQEIDAESLENLPQGLDGSQYQWVDLDGEGTGGILTEQGSGWFYKRNLSPHPPGPKNSGAPARVCFSPAEQVVSKPNATLAVGQAQFMDLAGDGQQDLVQMEGPVRGFYERTHNAEWTTLRPFKSWPNLNTRDPNLKFVDLTGDGHADILISEDGVFAWYESLGEDGFTEGARVQQALDEEEGPRLIFADGTQWVYLADLSGDGLTDLARIRNGDICYWPNLGYGRFGGKVTMDNAPFFDRPDQFSQQRIRLADIDGSGTTDIIYLGRQGIHIYRNQSGNSWAESQHLSQCPPIDNVSTVMVLDLLGNGTACLAWSSPLPGHVQQPMRYIDLMGGQKPHLLTRVVNNLGAETHIHYAPSTKFYLKDQQEGRPWITKLPFPVHVVERVEPYDRISRNRFVTRYAYKHGYFDGVEREFRGFGMVEQWDTEEFAALEADGRLDDAENLDQASHVPPVLTRTWFHTGAYLDREHISRQFEHEYYREPGLTPDQARDLLLPDTILPDDLTIAEQREACRALKGSMLRQEVYARDSTDKAEIPYTVTEQNFTVRRLQPHDGNRHAVFFTHAREAINYHYERFPEDPRVSHALTLDVDSYGDVLKEIAVGYGRRPGHSPLTGEDKKKQEQILLTYTENEFTNAIDFPPDDPGFDPDNYRTPLPCETRTYELTGLAPAGNAPRFAFVDLVKNDFEVLRTLQVLPYETPVDYTKKRKRLIESVRTLYRKNNLTGLLPFGTLESMALPGESYELAFTPGMLGQVYRRDGHPLLPDPTSVLGGQDPDRGGYVNLDNDGHWWIPTGRMFYHPNPDISAGDELNEARGHFFLPRCFRDPFGSKTVVHYDGPIAAGQAHYDLLVTRTIDALNNEVRAENNYRVLQPRLVTDPNGNRSEAVFDVLGMVVGTSVMGKVPPAKVEGDSLEGFEVDLADTVVAAHLQDPLSDPHSILGKATTRLVYDLFAYHRSREMEDPQPSVVYTLARETHASDLSPGQQTKVQHSFSYSDGFGREIQKKIQAEPEKINGVAGPPRWVGSGWIIFNNKGKPVRQYEPSFSATHGFEFGMQVGVSPILFYDPVERVVATLHPNHTYEKVVFDPWQQTTWDVSDTLHPPPNPGDLPFDPKDDPDIGHYFQCLPDDQYLPTWYDLRTDAQKAKEMWPDTDARGEPIPDNAKRRAAEKSVADKAAAHADTPTAAHLDTLGRPFLTVAHNKVVCTNHDLDGTEDKFHTHVELDIEGNQREVRDAVKGFRDEHGHVVTDELGRIVMRYDYDMLGNRMHQASMEAGERWILNDVTGNPIRAWDSRGQQFRTTYDQLRRSTEFYLIESAGPVLVEKTVYGETTPTPEANNLRGQAVQLFDQAGIVTSDDYDFKGNLLSSRRQLAQEYETTLDWSAAVPLEASIYTSSTRYDALNRPIQLTVPHSDQPGTRINVIQPGYNEANLLEQVNAWLNLNAEPADLLDPTTANLNAVTDIDYDAKGQRVLIDYGNGVRTTYEYDPLTFRLAHLLTRRDAATFPYDCPEPPPTGWPGCQVQNLHYTYDPAGNVTHTRDDAQQTVYFKNKRVEPSADYTYDATYRLIEATGREHLGQTGGTAIRHFRSDADRVGVLSAAAGRFSPNDGNAMGTYIEHYVYDAVGNFLKMQHRGIDPAHTGWTRSYSYAESSLIEAAKLSNRLTKTTVGNDANLTETYSYADAQGNDVHGCMTAINNRKMVWDFEDQLQKVDLGGGGTAYYVYDAAGQRVRKVWEKSANLIEERIYLGGFEIFRRHGGAIGPNSATFERETLHIMDDKQLIALIETRTEGDEPGVPKQLIRYQFGNHLGSASLELDDQAQIISYEEYTPYNSTSYQAVRSQTETSKRYRHTGKERDEESGLYYHGARYYAPWLGRWTKPDPAGSVDGTNLYMYVRDNPVSNTDSTGRQCDPTIQSCIDPTSSSESEDLVLQSFPVSTSPVSSPISSAPPGTNFAAEAARARATFRANNPMPEGSQAQHWTKEISARNTNMDPAVMNENMSPLQSRNARPATTLLTDPNGRGTTYTVDNGSTYGNEHKFADRHLIPEIERATFRANPTADPKAVAVDAGRQARWAMTGEPGPEPVPEARATPRFFGPTTGAVINGAVIAGIGGRTITQLHEGKPKEAAKTAVVGAAVYVAIKKVPALLPLVIMKSTIDAYDKKIEEKALADGDWWESATGSRTVGGLASAASATGRSAFEGTFGVTGKAIGEGAAAAYIRVTSDKYTLVPWKSQWWADTF